MLQMGDISTIHRQHVRAFGLFHEAFSWQPLPLKLAMFGTARKARFAATAASGFRGGRLTAEWLRWGESERGTLRRSSLEKESPTCQIGGMSWERVFTVNG